MYAAIRSPIVAGVTLVGAGAIAVSPIAATPPDIHLPAVRLTAMQSNPGFENPIDVFAPILQQTLQDTQSLLTQESRDPFPIVRAGLLDLTSAFGLIGPVPQPVPQPGPGLGNAFSTPTAAATVGRQVLAGGALGSVTNPVGGVANTVQVFLQNQLTVAVQLAGAVPQAAFGVMVSTFNAVVQTTLAVISAGVGVVGAVATLNPVRVWNSIVNGTALVAKVVEQTTIGQPQFNKTNAVGSIDAAPSIGISRIPSIAVSINNGRRLIANALSPQLARAQAAQAPVTGAQLAAANTTATSAVPSTAGATPAAKPAKPGTTGATPAAKVAKKPTEATPAAKVATPSVQKAAAGASTAAAQ
jgi:hypothetical protein